MKSVDDVVSYILQRLDPSQEPEDEGIASSPQPKPQESVRPLSALKLGRATIRALEKSCVFSVEGLAKMTSKDLIACPDISAGMIAEISQALRRVGRASATGPRPRSQAVAEPFTDTRSPQDAELPPAPKDSLRLSMLPDVPIRLLALTLSLAAENHAAVNLAQLSVFATSAGVNLPSLESAMPTLQSVGLHIECPGPSTALLLTPRPVQVSDNDLPGRLHDPSFLKAVFPRIGVFVGLTPNPKPTSPPLTIVAGARPDQPTIQGRSPSKLQIRALPDMHLRLFIVALAVGADERAYVNFHRLRDFLSGAGIQGAKLEVLSAKARDAGLTLDARDPFRVRLLSHHTFDLNQSGLPGKTRNLPFLKGMFWRVGVLIPAADPAVFFPSVRIEWSLG